MPMLKIAVPVVMAELGWMTMGVVDTVMVGPLGPEAISAAGVGNSMHIAFAIFGMAVMLGLDTLVSQAYGARDIRDCHRWFFDGLMLAATADRADHGAARAGVVRDSRRSVFTARCGRCSSRTSAS